MTSRIIHEPLLHFLLIGMAVFLGFGLRTQPSQPSGTEVIEVTPGGPERLSAQFERVWRRPPTDAELRGLIDDFVREEVYYREALALGLDRDDTVIRQRLRQKMEFLADSGVGTLTPSEADLRDYYSAHLEGYTRPERVTFQQVFLGEDDPAPVLAALAGGADATGLGRGSLLPAAMEDASGASVDGTFGDGFLAGVAALEPGVWGGPVTSAYGAHLVRLIELKPAEVSSFDEVRDRVEVDWRQQAAEDLREAQYLAMRARYKVVLPPIGGAR